MSWMEVNGIALGVQSFERTGSRREFGVGLSGNPTARKAFRSSLRGFSRVLTTKPLPADEARFWHRLFTVGGDVWSFEANDDVSSNGRSTLTPITPASNNPRWGTYHLDRTGTNLDIIRLESTASFTIIYWYDSGGGYEHVVSTRLPGDVADRIWVDGVRNDAYSQPHNVDLSVLTLDTNGDFDDIVVLQYGIPTTLADEVIRVAPFSSLPKIDVRGTGVDHRTIEVSEATSLEGVNFGSEIRWRFSATVEEYERP